MIAFSTTFVFKKASFVKSRYIILLCVSVCHVITCNFLIGIPSVNEMLVNLLFLFLKKK